MTHVTDLLDVGPASGLVAILCSSIRVQIERVNVNALGDTPAHVCETLRCETIIFRCIRTIVPFGAVEVNPVIVRQGVQTASNASCYQPLRNLKFIRTRRYSDAPPPLVAVRYGWVSYLYSVA